ncbi:MAG: hypothetical protein RI564_11675 [Gracilimonas sp.]|jgi:O-antigen/teichoic acid export membrane protein|nr:hypothetical protein [Gracilimonas sp.]
MSTDFKELSREELAKKIKSFKMLAGISAPIILGLIFFIVRDYLQGDGIDMALLTIVICSLSLPIIMFEKIKEMRKEMNRKI